MKKGKKPIGKPDKVLLLVTILLIIIGIFYIISASSRETVIRYDISMYYFFKKHIVILGAALLASLIIFKVDTYKYKILSIPMFLGILSLFGYLAAKATIKRGSLGWFENGGQPSELAKPIIIVALAVLFNFYEQSKKYNKEYSFSKFHSLFILIGIVIPIITFIMGDTGTALLTIGIVMTMYIFGPLNNENKIKGLGVFFLLFVIGISFLGFTKGRVLTEEQVSRFDFYDPCSKYETSGYQICNGLIGMNDGGIFGLGLGKSKQKYSYIPDPHTDSIYAIVVEESGLKIGLLILILYYVMIMRILKIAYETKKSRNRYICIGIAAYLFFHILFNLGGLLAIFPLTGVPLPLISYGGSFTISFIASLAVVQRIKMEI